MKWLSPAAPTSWIFTSSVKNQYYKWDGFNGSAAFLGPSHFDVDLFQAWIAPSSFSVLMFATDL